MTTDVIEAEFDDSEVDTTRPDLTQFEHLLPEHTTAATGTFLGLDAIDINQMHGLQFFWCAGYVGGFWPTAHPLVIAYPALAKAGRIFSYAVSATEDADWCDCERGDLSIQQVPGWLARQFSRGHKKPGVYASWDYWHNQGLLNQLAHYGTSITRIVAHYTYVAQIAHPGFDVQQFTDRYANRNLDGNVALGTIFPPAPAPPVANPMHYDRFDKGPFNSPKWGKLNEREIVGEYDGARQHPQKYKTYLPLLEAKLKWLSDRVYTVAHSPLGKDGKPTWGLYYRGWRFQQLVHRAHGMQFVPSPPGGAA